MSTMGPRELERASAAVTLSDMEVFIFPELMYALLLANLMSPRIWKWRDDPWFAGFEKKKPHQRIMRLKQYIMDHYVFNLDLDTWGLTTKDRELARFRSFIDEQTLRESNALFGYEGDKYYFDIDIRSHFGLDKYSGDVIPYWKTETVEAMDAFRHKPAYQTGAGECVSLAALYAAALFIVARIPLRDIYLMATPLHSQNYVDVGEGILTNNRRLVTKTMWFNGTALSAQARRALENERVTVVAHESGWIHTMYPDATIDPAVYAHFSAKLRSYLVTPLDDEVIGNFLRHANDIQKCFQLRWPLHGVDHYLPLEKAFAYEESCSYSVTDDTRAKLMTEIDTDEFSPGELPGRIVLNDLEAFLQQNRIDLCVPADVQRLKEQFVCGCLNAEVAMESLVRFCRVQPRLPDAAAKRFAAGRYPLGITAEMGRDDVIRRVEALRTTSEVTELAFHAYRDLSRVDHRPFVKAAMERSPVSVAGTAGKTDDEVVQAVAALPGESIYDDAGRLAQPDEVWNYGRGDGVERALLLANVLRARNAGLSCRLEITASHAILVAGGRRIEFATAKGLAPQTWELG